MGKDTTNTINTTKPTAETTTEKGLPKKGCLGQLLGILSGFSEENPTDNTNKLLYTNKFINELKKYKAKNKFIGDFYSLLSSINFDTIDENEFDKHLDVFFKNLKEKIKDNSGENDRNDIVFFYRIISNYIKKEKDNVQNSDMVDDEPSMCDDDGFNNRLVISNMKYSLLLYSYSILPTISKFVDELGLTINQDSDCVKILYQQNVEEIVTNFSNSIKQIMAKYGIGSELSFEIFDDVDLGNWQTKFGINSVKIREDSKNKDELAKCQDGKIDSERIQENSDSIKLLINLGSEQIHKKHSDLNKLYGWLAHEYGGEYKRITEKFNSIEQFLEWLDKIEINNERIPKKFNSIEQLADWLKSISKNQNLFTLPEILTDVIHEEHKENMKNRENRLNFLYDLVGLFVDTYDEIINKISQSYKKSGKKSIEEFLKSLGDKETIEDLHNSVVDSINSYLYIVYKIKSFKSDFYKDKKEGLKEISMPGILRGIKEMVKKWLLNFLP